MISKHFVWGTLIGFVIVIMCILLCTGCNKQLFDTTYKFNYAYVVWPDGTSEKLKLKSWKDYEGEQIQIKSSSGNTYLFSSENWVLAQE